MPTLVSLLEDRHRSIHIFLNQGISRSREFLSRKRGDKPSAFHQRNARTQQQRLAQIMRNKHHGLSQALLQSQEFALQFRARDGIQRPDGSSIRRIGGSAARPRATPTRCRCPPESSFG